MSLHRFASAPLVFVTLWIIWFLCPLTRPPALSQWRTRLGAPSDSDPNSRDAQYVRALKARPTLTPSLGVPVSPSEARAESFRELGRKFPDDPTICAAQIVNMTMYFRLGRGYGPSLLARTVPGWSVSVPPPKPPLDKKNLSEWIEATTRGSKLEPNNTFWDWAKLIGALIQEDSNKAYSVLRAARGKTGYDDYVIEGALAQIRVLGKEGPVSPSRQIGLNAAILLPHYSQMHEAARQVRALAFQSQQWGDASQKKTAIEGMRDLMELARPMRLESKFGIGSIVGQSLEATAFYGGADPPALTGTKPPRFGAPLSTYARDPRSLLLRARQMNRPDIVQQVSREWNDVGIWSNKAKPFIDSTSNYLIGVRQRDFWPAQIAHWISSLLLDTIPTLLAIALACSVLLALVPSWKRERQAQAQSLSVSWLGGTLIGLFVLILFAACLSWAFYHSLVTANYTPSLPLWLAISDSVPGLENVQLPSSWQQHFPALLSLTIALWLTATQNERRLGIPTLGTRLRNILVAPDDGIVRFDFSPLLSLAVTLAIYSLAILGTLGALLPFTVLSRYFSFRDSEGIPLLIIAFLLIVPALIRLRTPQGRVRALLTIRQFAWSQLLFVTILWGVLWLVAMPAQTRFDQALNRSIQIGDMKLGDMKPFRKALGL